MQELNVQELKHINGGTCAEIAGGTMGAAVIGGGLKGASRGMWGGIKGIGIGFVVGAAGAAAAYGVCSMLE